jgi:salicylate 5-hydroxylase large subunit
MKAEQTTPSGLDRQWPQAGATRVPYWAYSDQQVYQREMDVIFCGESWAYVGLGVEIPNPGDFKQVSIGDRPLVMCRDEDGVVRVFENRCAHRGVKFCREPWGNAKQFTCPYHLWRYDLKGNLRGLPFLHGVKQQGGMPDDFRREDHGLGELRVSDRGGAIFATFSPTVEAFEDYLGPTFLALYDRMFDGRDLTLLGYTKQLIPSNWKLMFENLKDPYHASLMHVFLVTFGLYIKYCFWPTLRLSAPLQN